jgi:hypothetical protein
VEAIYDVAHPVYAFSATNIVQQAQDQGALWVEVSVRIVQLFSSRACARIDIAWAT